MVAVAASGLAVSTGVALDRVVLPELRSERTAASGPGAEPSALLSPGPQSDETTAAGTGTGTAGGGTASGGAPAPTAQEQTPPLKPMRAPGSAAKPSKPDAPSTPDKPPADTGTPGGGGTPGSSGPEAAVIALTNAERAKAGCRPLRADERLATAARKHSADMAANDYFDHTSRNGDSPWERMEDAGYPSPGAENIAKGYPTAQAVMEGWMNSPGHRANILNCDLRAIGVGRASGSGGPVWTQDFGWK